MLISKKGANSTNFYFCIPIENTIPFNGSHLLFGIDDGCDNLQESIKLLKEMEKAGTTDLLLTPHYVEDTKYDCNNDGHDK